MFSMMASASISYTADQAVELIMNYEMMKTSNISPILVRKVTDMSDTLTVNNKLAMWLLKSV